MLRHIVSWKLAASDLAVRLEQSGTITASLEALVPIIPEIISLSVSTNAAKVEGNWDLVLVGDFADEHALQAYIDHPEHQRVVGEIRGFFAQRSAIDILV